MQNLLSASATISTRTSQKYPNHEEETKFQKEQKKIPSPLELSEADSDFECGSLKEKNVKYLSSSSEEEETDFSEDDSDMSDGYIVCPYDGERECEEYYEANEEEESPTQTTTTLESVGNFFSTVLSYATSSVAIAANKFKKGVVESYKSSDAKFLNELTGSYEINVSFKKFAPEIQALLMRFFPLDGNKSVETDIEEGSDKIEMVMLHLLANIARKKYPKAQESYKKSKTIEEKISLEQLTQDASIYIFEMIIEGFNKIDGKVCNGTPFSEKLFEELKNDLIHLIVHQSEDGHSLWQQVGWIGAEKIYVKRYFGSLIVKGLMTAYQPMHNWLKESYEKKSGSNPSTPRKKIEVEDVKEDKSSFDWHVYVKAFLPLAKPFFNYLAECFCTKFQKEDLEVLQKFTINSKEIEERIALIAQDLTQIFPHLTTNFGFLNLLEIELKDYRETCQKVVESILLRLLTNIALEIFEEGESISTEEFFTRTFLYLGKLVNKHAMKISENKSKQLSSKKFIKVTDELSCLMRKRLHPELERFIANHTHKCFEPIAEYLLQLYLPMMNWLHSTGEDVEEEGMDAPSHLLQSNTLPIIPFILNHLPYFIECLSVFLTDRGKQDLTQFILKKDRERFFNLVKELSPFFFSLTCSFFETDEEHAQEESLFSQIIKTLSLEESGHLVEGLLLYLLANISKNVFFKKDEKISLEDFSFKIFSFLIQLFQKEFARIDSLGEIEDFFPLAERLIQLGLPEDKDLICLIKNHFMRFKYPLAKILMEVHSSFASIEKEKNGMGLDEGYEGRLRFLFWDEEAIKKEHPNANIPDTPTKNLSEAFNRESYITSISSCCDRNAAMLISWGKSFLVPKVKKKPTSKLFKWILSFLPDLSPSSKKTLRKIIVIVFGGEIEKEESIFEPLEKLFEKKASLLIFKGVVHLLEGVEQPENSEKRLSVEELCYEALLNIIVLFVKGFHAKWVEERIEEITQELKKNKITAVKRKLKKELRKLEKESIGEVSFAKEIIKHFFPDPDGTNEEFPLAAHIPGFSYLKKFFASKIQNNWLPKLIDIVYEKFRSWIVLRDYYKEQIDEMFEERPFVLHEACYAGGRLARDFLLYYLKNRAPKVADLLLDKFGHYFLPQGTEEAEGLPKEAPQRELIQKVLISVLEKISVSETKEMKASLDFFQNYAEAFVYYCVAHFFQGIDALDVKEVLRLLLDLGKDQFKIVNEEKSQLDPLEKKGKNLKRHLRKAFKNKGFLHSGMKSRKAHDKFFITIGKKILNKAHLNEETDLPIWPPVLKDAVWDLMEIKLFPLVIGKAVDLFKEPYLLNRILLSLLTKINPESSEDNLQNIPERIFDFFRERFSRMSSLLTIPNPKEQTVEDPSPNEPEDELHVLIKNACGQMAYHLIGLHGTPATFLLEFEKVQEVVGNALTDVLFQFLKEKTVLTFVQDLLYTVLPKLFENGKWDEMKQQIVIVQNVEGEDKNVRPFFDLHKLTEDNREGRERVQKDVIDALASTMGTQTEQTVVCALRAGWSGVQEKVDEAIKNNLGSSGIKTKNILDDICRFLYNNVIRIVIMILVLPPFLITEFVLYLYYLRQAKKRGLGLHDLLIDNIVYKFCEEFVEKVTHKMSFEEDMDESYVV